jgi:hypothetical protein
MPRFIEIEGDLVSLIEKNIIQSIPLTEFLPKIERRIPIVTPVLPTNTRAVWWDTTDLSRQKLLVLMEREPQVINMNLTGRIHALTIPWTRFMFYASTRDPNQNLFWHLDDYRVFWSNKRYTDGAAQDMLAAMIPNVYDDARICFGSTGAEADQNLADRLDQTVNEFYISNFNHDLTIRRPNGWTNWGTWKRETLSNPASWANWTDWTQRTHDMTSWNKLCEDWFSDSTPRYAPMIASDPIPEVPLGATFGRINEWITTMNPDQYRRLFTAVSNTPPTEHAELNIATEDEDDDYD